MNDYNDGQIHGWNGGECPVHPKSEVMFWFRGMSGYVNDAGRGCLAASFDWNHYGGKLDIVCFQVTKPYVEPKTIWVNQYSGIGSIGVAWPTEEMAKENAIDHRLSAIAVKYVEAKE